MRSVVSIVAAIAVVVGLATTSAFAQRDSGAKARGEVGTGFWNSSRQQSHVARTYVRSGQSQIAAKKAPEAVAKNDAQGESTQRRSFEPAPKVEKGTGCTGKSSNGYQRRSYEPSAGSSSVRMNASRSSNTPSYMMQKSDPQKYRTH